MFLFRPFSQSSYSIGPQRPSAFFTVRTVFIRCDLSDTSRLILPLFRGFLSKYSLLKSPLQSRIERDRVALWCFFIFHMVKFWSQLLSQKFWCRKPSPLMVVGVWPNDLIRLMALARHAPPKSKRDRILLIPLQNFENSLNFPLKNAVIPSKRGENFFALKNGTNEL